jgi:hypothetical protein
MDVGRNNETGGKAQMSECENDPKVSLLVNLRGLKRTCRVMSILIIKQD